MLAHDVIYSQQLFTKYLSVCEFYLAGRRMNEAPYAILAGPTVEIYSDIADSRRSFSFHRRLTHSWNSSRKRSLFR